MTADWADHSRACWLCSGPNDLRTWRQADHLASPRPNSPRLALQRLTSQHLARPQFACASSERLPSYLLPISSHLLRAPSGLRAPSETLLAVLLQLVGIRTEEEALLHK